MSALKKNREKEKILKGKKKLADKIIEYTNEGAWKDEDLRNKYAEALGWPKLTDENIKEITRLAELADKAPEGKPKGEKIQDLLDYQERYIKGIDYGEVTNAAWYASVLSGFGTHIKKEVSELTTTFLEASNSMLYILHFVDVRPQHAHR